MNDTHLREQLEALIERHREVQLQRGLLLTAAAALVGLLTLMLLDLGIDLPHPLYRCALAAAALLATGLTAYHWIIKPRRNRPTSLQAARYLEARHPELEERLSTSLHLLGQQTDSSAQLQQAVIAAAETDALSLLPEEEVETRRLRHGLVIVALALVACLGVAIASPRLLGRALTPWANHGNVHADKLMIHPGNRSVARGQTLTISVHATTPAPARIERRNLDGRSTERMSPGTNTQHHLLSLPPIEQPFDYRIHAGRARSPWFHISVDDAPHITNLIATITPPAYTGWPVQYLAHLPDPATILTNSRIELTAQTDTPASHATVDGHPIEQLTWTHELLHDHRPNWTLTGQHTLQSSYTHELRAGADEAPTLTLLIPAEPSIHLRADATLRLSAELRDDIGAGSVELIIDLPNAPQHRLATLSPEQRRSQGPEQPLRSEMTMTLPLASLPLATLDRFSVYLEIHDTAPNPQAARSRRLEIVLDKSAPSQMNQALAEQRATIDEALQETREALERAQAQADTLPEPATRQATGRERSAAAELATETRRTQQALETLANTLEDSAFAPLADTARETSGASLEASTAHAETLPLTEPAAARDAERLGAQADLASASEQLESLAERVNTMDSALQELAELAALADQEQAIAAAATQADPAIDDLAEQQDKTTKAIGEQIQQQPSELAAQEQAANETAQALAQEVGALAEQQAALSDSPPPEALNDAQSKLGEAAGSLAAQAAALAALNEALHLSEAARSAEASATQLAQAKRSAEAAAEAARKSATENSGKELATAQQEALDQLNAAAEALGGIASVERGPQSAGGEGTEPSSTDAEPGSANQATSGTAQGEEASPEAASPLGKALDAASEASAASTAPALAKGASEAASQLAQAVQDAQAALGLPNGLPGIPSPGDPSAGGETGPEQQGSGMAQAEKGEGQAQGDGAGQMNEGPGGISQQGNGESGGGSDEAEGVATTLAPRKLGLDADDWATARGELSGSAAGTRAAAVPPAYRKLVEQYFEQLAKDAAE